jgi:hypothetical protein
MANTVLPWAVYTEAVVGLNHPTLADVDNRSLRAMLGRSSFQVDQSFPGLPVGSSAINAGSSDYTGTAPVRITAAIADCFAQGKPYCFVPRIAWDGLAMLPYNASLVTFNSAVRMLRESAQPGVYDLKAYGATADGATNDVAAWQAVLTNVVNGSTIVVPSGNYAINGLPSIGGKSNIAIYAYEATFTLSGVNTEGLRFTSGATNSYITVAGLTINGSGASSDNQQGIGTQTSPPANTINTFITIRDVRVANTTRGIYFNRANVNDLTDLTYDNCTAVGIVGLVSGTGYGLCGSGVIRMTANNCTANACQRHGMYISACGFVTIANFHGVLHRTGIADGSQTGCLEIARNHDVTVVNASFDTCADGCLSIEPSETPTDDSGRIHVTGVTCLNSVNRDIWIGAGSPSGQAELRDVIVSKVIIGRSTTEVGNGFEYIRIRSGKRLTLSGVSVYGPAAYTGLQQVVYVAADGGASFSDQITVEGIRASFPSLGVGGNVALLSVNSNLSTGTQQLTILHNEGQAIGGSLGHVILYNATKTNPNIVARFNRLRGLVFTGTATLVGGTVTVSTAEIETGDTVALSRLAAGGTLGHLSVGTITANSSFVINSSSGTDTSVVLWEIVH